VNEKGETLTTVGNTDPAPFSVIVMEVALPLKEFPLTVIGTFPQTFPVLLLRITEGPLTHPHDTENGCPVAVHPEELRTVIVCVPFGTSVKILDPWKLPLSSLYSIPLDTGF
jgi:hypothetical protein